MVDNIKFEYKGLGVRHLQCVLLFMGLMLTLGLRVNLSVAIVAMTDALADSQYGVYHWDEKIKSVILSSFFWGYVCLQIPAGVLAQNFGGHKVLFTGLTLCSVLALLTPICSQIGGWKLLCALRLIQGLCQGCVMPSTHSLISRWAPIKERGKLGIIIYSGAPFGTALMFCLSGEIASTFLGWPGIFYVSGGIGCIWGLLFYFFGASSPAESKIISEEERQFIEAKPVPTDETEKIKDEKDDEDAPKRKLKTPWSDILKSLPFYCILLVHCADSWTHSILLTQTPNYFRGVFSMDIKRNAVLSSVPYLAMLVMSFFFAFMADVLRKTECMSLSVSRKFFNTVGTWVPMIGLIGLGYISKEQETIAVCFLIVIVGLKSACALGYFMNHIDLSPNFASTLMGMTNAVAHVFAILAPLTVGFIVTDPTNLEQWRIIFFITGGLLFLGNVLFILFGKFQTQYWNEPNEPVIVKVSLAGSLQSVYKDKDGDEEEQ